MNVIDVNALRAEKAVFITGTDTGIGKTFVSVELIQALRTNGRCIQAMKPVASGCEWINNAWQNEDAMALLQATQTSADYALVNPYALPLATAPQIASKACGVTIDLEKILSAFRVLEQQADIVLIEGVGGWLAPLSDTLDQSHLVHALNVPVILVVGMRLGCINHARLSEQAIQQSGCTLLGWIANEIEPGFDASGEYLHALQAVMKSPSLGRVCFQQT